MRARLALAAALLASACNATSTPVAAGNPDVRADLYQCEGCEGARERDPSGMASDARIGPATEPGEPLLVTGRVFEPDGRTPAAGVVIYAYQTNSSGLYANGTPETEWSRRHGNLRGWAKSGADGRYTFRTIKPAPYPNDTMPAHIHFTILEPGKRPYWIDDIVFEGEFGVTPEYRAKMENRGGNGIVPLARTADGTLRVTRDIVLERHPG